MRHKTDIMAIVLCLGTALQLTSPVWAEESLRILPETVGGKPTGKVVGDRLLDMARDHLGKRRETMEKVVSPEQISRRQAYVRKTIIDSIGGLPERTPLNARIVGTIDREDFLVEKVIFDSLPGFPVTAVLYLPKTGQRPLPAVLVPCGHSAVGKAEPAYQSACILMARNGLAALCYDPISQGERMQTIGEDGKILIPSSTSEHTNVGLGALLGGSHAAGIRIWDGMRAIDYLQSRQDIDPQRIGVTGNSGGGTMTSYLMCVDDRVRAAAPSCYLTSFQRLLETIGPQDAEQNFTGFIAAGLDHADFIERMAPKPVLVCAATHDFFDIGGTWDTFREAKRFYNRAGFPERVDIIEAEDKHGFSRPRRIAAARWMRRWLLDAHEPIDEPEQKLFSTEALRCTRTGQVLTGIDSSRSAYDLNRAAEAKLAPARASAFQSMDRGKWLQRVAELIGASDSPIPEGVEPIDEIERETYGITTGRFEVDGFPVPGVLCVPVELVEDRIPIVYAGSGGFAKDAVEGGPIDHLAQAGHVVLAVDLPGTGETAKGTPRRSDLDKRFGPDWPEIFLAFHLDKTYVGLRADVLRAAIELLSMAVGVDTSSVGLIGLNDAAVVALHAAAIDERFARVITEGGIDSFASLVQAESSADMLQAVVPGALEHYDLDLLVESIKPRSVRRLGPIDPMRKPIGQPAEGAPDRFVKMLAK